MVLAGIVGLDVASSLEGEEVLLGIGLALGDGGFATSSG
jgi:hypothetical protein